VVLELIATGDMAGGFVLRFSAGSGYLLWKFAEDGKFLQKLHGENSGK
jgi:hypothetical protein